mmetsp:Transcript_15897/g.34873  ORF Transcript_15897/g.34873 Transcript_15897/m.34873 type:complete len:203 (-) Transcript_15897:1429-2037(-)
MKFVQHDWQHRPEEHPGVRHQDAGEQPPLNGLEYGIKDWFFEPLKVWSLHIRSVKVFNNFSFAGYHSLLDFFQIRSLESDQFGVIWVGADSAAHVNRFQASSSDDDHHILLCQVGVLILNFSDAGNQALCQIQVGGLINDNGRRFWALSSFPFSLLVEPHCKVNISANKVIKTFVQNCLGPAVASLLKFVLDIVDPIELVRN